MLQLSTDMQTEINVLQQLIYSSRYYYGYIIKLLVFGVTLNNASDYRTNGLYQTVRKRIIGLTDNGLGLEVRYSHLVRCIVKYNPVFGKPVSVTSILAKSEHKQGIDYSHHRHVAIAMQNNS